MDWDDEEKLDRSLANLSDEREGREMVDSMIATIFGVLLGIGLVSTGLHWVLGWLDKTYDWHTQQAVFGWLHSALGALGGFLF